jgi:hypothetical protein
MPFFHYSQNNNNSSFDYDETRGITHHVVIEAASPDEADSRAEQIGLYWNGCDDGRDCDCCGDRWYQTHGDGDVVPAIYDEPITATTDVSRWMDEGREIAVHHADGRIEWF